MPGNQGIPVSQLARDYGASLNEFVEEVISTLAKLDVENEPPRNPAQRREICAAVSAAMTSALDASALTADERAKLAPLLDEVLSPFWARHCASDPEAAPYIAMRAEHYLANRAADSQVKTAVNIVAELAEALQIPPVRVGLFSMTLAPAFAHRMVGDVYHINEVRSRLHLELPVFVVLAALLQFFMHCQPVLAALQFS